MQLVGITNHGPRFFSHLRDRRRIERADSCGIIGRQRAAQLHGSGAPFFKRRIVEVRERIRIQNFVTERRRLRRIDGRDFERSFVHALQQAHHALHVHRFVQTIGDGFVHQRMIGNANLAFQIFRARDLIRENGG